MASTREALLAELARAEAWLADLDQQRRDLGSQVERLRAQIATGSPAEPSSSPSPLPHPERVPTTPAEKVRLFRDLFKGRENVFPTRFLSRKTGQAGYAPACASKFVQGVCGLPKIKCGDCPNQAFLPIDDQVIRQHLRGDHVMGLYPLLEDETCWLLAIDFDKSSWQADVAALVETCDTMRLPVAVERSRSGNGAHAWFFFESPLAASLARKMGCYLLTETMSRRHQLSVASYDRLFPNQDTLPRGGFGNLVALPLQYEARRQGNTVFVDEEFRAHPDQWGYLASVRRIGRSIVEALAREGTKLGLVVLARRVEPESGEPTPSGRDRQPARQVQFLAGLPREVHSVLADRLFIETVGLPGPLLSEIKRLAAFQNPEFYKRQNLRLSTAMTPRVISCAEELPHGITLPRGCLSDLEALLRDHDVQLVVEDRRQYGSPLSLSFRGELTADQQQAAQTLLQHDSGVFVAPPGTGKTVLGTYLTASRARRTLVLVHRRPLLDQWVAQLALFLGIAEKEVGQSGGGKRRLNGHLDVAMFQSLMRDGSVEETGEGYGQVIVDECHHVPAVSFERVISRVRARYLLGLTATPQRRDGLHPILEMYLGPVRSVVDPRGRTSRRSLDRRLIPRETAFRLDSARGVVRIQQLYKVLAEDEARNRLIFDDVLRALEEGRSPILLTERRDHLESFAARLRGFVRHLVILHGGMTARERQETVAQRAGIPEGEERLVLATGRFVGEGFDDARLDTLFLALPVSWKGTLVQYAGRLHRLRPAKSDVRIFDYVDPEVPMLKRMFEKRLRTYRAIGYACSEAPLGSEDAAVEPTLEYDEQALRHFADLGDGG